MKLKIKVIEVDEDIYPRKHLVQKTVESYQDSLQAGAVFPAILVQKVLDEGKERTILLDGAHRRESHKNKDIDEIEAEYWKEEVLDKNDPEILEQLRVKALQANLEHGERLKESDVAFQCERIVKARPVEKLTGVQKFLSQKFNLTEGRISQLVGTLVNSRKASRDSIILRLKMLGWTTYEIPDIVGIKQSAVAQIIKNFNAKEINYSFKSGKTIEELSSYYNLDQTLTWAIVLEGKSDQERFELLDFEPKVYDAWNYPKCDKLMGQQHPGQIPGQIVLNTLYYNTEPGDLVADLMAGGGITNDACLLMGRKCYSYDIDPVENRKDIIQHDFLDGLPERAKKATLIFLDPPYFKKKEVEYGSESISALNREDYLKTMDKLAEICKGKKVAFVMGKYYDYENPKDSIFMTDYINIFEKHKFRQVNEISINQQPPDGGQYAVIQAKEKQRMEILKRDLAIFEWVKE